MEYCDAPFSAFKSLKVKLLECILKKTYIVKHFTNLKQGQNKNMIKQCFRV